MEFLATKKKGNLNATLLCFLVLDGSSVHPNGGRVRYLLSHTNKTTTTTLKLVYNYMEGNHIALNTVCNTDEDDNLLELSSV